MKAELNQSSTVQSSTNRSAALDLNNEWERALKGSLISYSNVHKLLYPELFCCAASIVRSEKEAAVLLNDLFVSIWINRLHLKNVVLVKEYFLKLLRSRAWKLSSLKDAVCLTC